MSKSILILDENSVIHGLISSALDVEGLTLHHEFNPAKFAERAKALSPDLILLGNPDHDPEFRTAQNLRAETDLGDIPLVLMTGSKLTVDSATMEDLQVKGLVRKPFEASDLQQQVSKHLDLSDLVGAAFEFQQSQSTRENAINPLANLDVVDDEVLGIMREENTMAGQNGDAAAGPPPAFDEPAPAKAGVLPMKGVAVVDDEVLVDALEPERAFEAVPGALDPDMPSLDTTPALDLDIAEETMEDTMLEEPGVDGLEELGASDLLEEDTPEEAAFEPQGFDQTLDGEESPSVTRHFDDIEVELPDEDLDLGAVEDELDSSELEPVEMMDDLDGEDDGAVEEAVPQSVQRMMAEKPLFGGFEEAPPPPLDDDALASAQDDALVLEDDVPHMEGELSEDDQLAEEARAAREAGELDEDLPPLEDDIAPTAEAAFDDGDDFPPLDDEPAAEAQPEEDLPDLMTEPAATKLHLEPQEGGLSVFEPEKEAAPESLDEAFSTDMRPEDELDAEDIDDSLFSAEIQPISADEDDDMPTFEEAMAESSMNDDTYSEPDLDSLEDDFVATPLPHDDDDEEAFTEEFLGDEQIDEEQMLSTAEVDDLPPLDGEEDMGGSGMETMPIEPGDLEPAMVGEAELGSDALEEDTTPTEDLALEPEEESAIMGSLDTERMEDVVPEDPGLMEDPAQGEALFERNLKSLDEQSLQGATDLDVSDPPPEMDDAVGLGGAEEMDMAPMPDLMDDGMAAGLEEPGFEGNWEGDDSAMGMPQDEDGEEITELGDMELEPAEDEVLSLETPLEDEAPMELTDADLEEVPLEEQETGSADIPEMQTEDDLPPLEAGGAAAIEFGAGSEDVFDDGDAPLEEMDSGAALPDMEETGLEDMALETEDSHGEPDPWRPSAPPSFVPGPQEVFPEEAVEGEWSGTGVDSAEEPSPVPRHVVDEVLEDPDTMTPVLGEATPDELLPGLGGPIEEDSGLGAEALEMDQMETEPEEVAPTEDLLAEPDDEAFPDEDISIEEESLMDDMPEVEDIAPLAGGSTETLLGGSPDEAASMGLDDGGLEAGDMDDMDDLDVPDSDTDFDSVFASLQSDIAKNPEGERIDDILRNERITDMVSTLEFGVPERSNAFDRAYGVYGEPGNGGGSVYPDAMKGRGVAAFAEADAAGSAHDPATEAMLSGGLSTAERLHSLTLLDPSVRDKLGQVLDEIISMSVRKAVQEEMPKLMDQMAKEHNNE